MVQKDRMVRMKMTRQQKIERILALEEKRRRNAQSNYLEYLKYVYPDLKELPHTVRIANEINTAIENREKMLAGEIPVKNQYLMFNLPPRHGKSMTITESLPSYFMGKFDASKVIMVAYSITLADDFARSNADKIEEHKVFGNVIMSNNQDRMILSNRSACVKAGIAGGLTGKGAELMLIDDPIRTEEDAISQSTRDKAWRTWQSTLSTRFETATIVILVMTRWHEDDLAGRLLNEEYGKPLPWKVINLPLAAEEDDILGREVGEPLWEEQYGYDFIEERKQYVRTYNALYQGRPTSEQGNMLQRSWWNYYDKLPPIMYKLISVDAAFKDKPSSDFVAIQVWGKTEANMYLIDQINERLDFPATLDAIRKMKKKHPDVRVILIEDKANGSAAIQVLKREVTGVIPVEPRGGKVSRVNAVSPAIESGNVYIPNTVWAEEFVEQCSSFPNGAHDDMVDCMSQALNRFMYSLAPLPRVKQSDFFNVLHDEDESDSYFGGEPTEDYLTM